MCDRQIFLHTDTDVSGQVAPKRGVERMKHLNVRHCWLQVEMAQRALKVRRVERSENASNVLTHAPSADSLRRFFPSLGLFPLQCAEGSFRMLTTALKDVLDVQVAGLIWSLLAPAVKAEVEQAEASECVTAG